MSNVIDKELVEELDDIITRDARKSTDFTRGKAVVVIRLVEQAIKEHETQCQKSTIVKRAS